MTRSADPHVASWTLSDAKTAPVLRFAGALDARGAGPIWRAVLRAAAGSKGRTLSIDLAEVTAFDTSGAMLLIAAERANGGTASLQGASERVTAVLALVRTATEIEAKAEPQVVATWAQVFQSGLHVTSEAIAYLGEIAVACFRLPRRARMLRVGDLLRTADQAGLHAVPLVLLLGVLIGLILAFQSLVPMRTYGADIYVANLVAISLVRELGPLLAAVILSGRSGSAFAAEIGTMKVNQELDALETMGIDAVTMLVLPRIIAAVMVMPVLAILMELAGMLGMAMVLVGGGIPLTAIADQVAYWVVPRDVFGGLAKAAVFGAAIAAIGCRAGLSTGIGPRAVGSAATTAVVGGIVATMAIDGFFAVAFYKLGW